MTEMCITLATHHFVVSRINPRVRPAINEFAKTLIQYGLVKGRGRSFHQQAVKVYAASTHARDEFRFHINLLGEFKKILDRHYINDSMIEWRQKEVPRAAPIVLEMQPHLSDLERQLNTIEYLTKVDGPISRLVEMQTGGGKTYCAMRSMQEFEKRTVVMIKPGYIDQWLRDFKQNTLLNPKRLVTIKGSKELKSLLFMAADGELPYDVIVISNATYRNYLSEYEEYGKLLLEMDYACLPEDFFGHLKAGLRVIDEVHQDFHLNFKCDLYTNIERSISLSATFRSDNHFVNQMYEVFAPTRNRCAAEAYIKYVNAYSLQYSFGKPEKIRTVGAQGTYSHHEFEKSIMKDPRMVENYFRMVHSSMIFTYDHDYRKGNRCLVYFASIEMCTRFTHWIGEKYPRLTIARYVEDDSYEALLTADIGVSTIGSAGTGIDIPDLTTVILTTAIRSTQGNLQGFGRIRNLNARVKDEKDKRQMYFVYFVCTDFPKHVDYHDSKVELLRTRALVYEQRYYNEII